MGKTKEIEKDELWGQLDNEDIDSLFTIELDEETDNNQPDEDEEKGDPKKGEKVLDDESDDEEDSDDDSEADSDESEEDEDDTGNSDDDDGESGEDEDNPILELAQVLAEKGLITIPEDFNIESDEDFNKVIEHTINEGVDQYKKGLGPEALRVLEFVEAGGNIKDYVDVISDIPDYGSMNIEDDVEAQKQVYREYLKETTRFSESKIENLVEQAEIDMDLEDEAKSAQQYFKDLDEDVKTKVLEAQKNRDNKKKQERDEFISNTKSLISESAEIYDIPLGDKNKRKELESYILDAKIPHETPDGRKILITQMQKDRMDLLADNDRKYKSFILEAFLLKNNFNLSSVKKKGVTEHTKNMKNLAKKYKQKSTIGKNSSTGNKNPYRGGDRKLLFETEF